MTGKTHQVIGLTAGLAVYLQLAAPQYNPATLAAVVVCSHLAALLPDIDQPGSQLWRSLPFGKVAGQLSDPFLEHRNLTHSLLGLALIGWGIKVLLGHMPSYWGIDAHLLLISILVAYASHLLADMVTVEGVPLFFPLPRMFGIPPHPFDGFRIHTGAWFENLVVFPLINLIFLLLIYLNWSTIHQIILR